MGAYSGPEIVNDGIVLHIDAGNPQSYAGTDLEVEYLIVAGGGGGGCGDDASSLGGGGGGAGGFLYGKKSVATGSNSIVVGAGGAGKNGPNTGGASGSLDGYPAQAGANGSDSTAFGLTAVGGGGGGTRNAHENGKSGGSGGGACGAGADGTPASGGSATSGQGNAGGSNSAEWGSCGGGGAGSAGQSLSGSSSRIVGSGGDGLPSWITGEYLYYAGGGGGGGHNPFGGADRVGGIGGLGGGANGGTHSSTQGQNATANTGGGGGGGPAYIGNSQSNSDGGNGGSGVVIVRYRGPQKATGGDSIYEQDGYTVHKFTSSGSLVIGSTTGDVSYNENAGVLTNGVGYSSANNGGFDFDGVNDYVDCGTVSSLGNTFTVEVSVESDFSSAWNPLIFRDGNATDNFGLRFDSSGYIEARQFSGTELRQGPYLANTNYIICVTINSLSAILYVNGEQKGTHAFPNNFNDSGNIRLGIYSFSGGSYYGGKIYNAKVYNRALTATEVAQNFAATRGRFGI